MNFVCVVFELGDKMLTLSSMENLIVPCNLQGGWEWRIEAFVKIQKKNFFFFGWGGGGGGGGRVGSVVGGWGASGLGSGWM